jgi:hypothetical protein
MPRLNSQLEAEGAEFLVLGRLLIEKITAYKTYTNHPDYDLIAVNPRNHRAARIQVKSRWAIDSYKGFLAKRLDSDFIVNVRLNLGYKKRKLLERKRPSPEFYVFPTRIVKRARNKNTEWGKVMLKDIPNYEKYRGNWEVIRVFLTKPPTSIKKW